MTNTSMNIRMDSKIKQQAQHLFAEFGLDMTTAVNMFLRQAIRERRIPFELKLNPNAETIAAIDEVQEMKKKPAKGKSYKDVDEMMKDLLK